MDIRIDEQNEHFKYRVCGILEHNNKYLAVKIENNQFYCFPGGHAEIGETSEVAVLREMREELGFPVKIKRLASIAENIFQLKDAIVHEISFYFIVEAEKAEDVIEEDHLITECDKGVMKELKFKWLTKEEMECEDFRPNFASKLLGESMLYVTNKFDKDVEITEYKSV